MMFVDRPRRPECHTLFGACIHHQFLDLREALLESFDAATRAADIAAGVVAAVLLAVASAWSRYRLSQRHTKCDN